MNIILESTLWASSITLALIGIVFGIIAGRNSKKATDAVSSMIAQQHTQISSREYFLDRLKGIILVNKKVVHYLNQPQTYYDEYSIKLSHSRLPYMSKGSAETLSNAGYTELVNKYKEAKHQLDNSFNTIFNNDYSKLDTHHKITKGVKVRLINYHTAVIKLSKEIVTKYTKMHEQTREFKQG